MPLNSFNQYIKEKEKKSSQPFTGPIKPSSSVNINKAIQSGGLTVDKKVAPKVSETIKVPSQNTAVNFVKSLPGAIGETAKNIGQGITRNIASAGLSFTKPFGGTDELQPKGKVQQTIFGNEPIKPVEQRIADFEIKIQDMADKRAGQNPNFDPTLLKQTALPMAALAIGGDVLLDLIPSLGGEKNALKNIAKTGDINIIIKELKALGVPSEIMPSLSKQLVKTNTEKGVADVISKSLRSDITNNETMLLQLEDTFKELQKAKKNKTDKIAIKGIENAQQKILQEMGKITQSTYRLNKPLATIEAKKLGKEISKPKFIQNKITGKMEGSESAKRLEDNPQAGFINLDEIKKSFKNLLSKKPASESIETGQQLKATDKGLQKEIPKSLEDVSTFYNINRLNIGEEAKKAVSKEIGDAGETISKIVGGKLSNKEVLDIADTTSSILNKVTTRQQTAEKIAANLKLRQKIAQVAKEGKIDKEFIELWMKDKAAGEDIARQLQARSINADPKEASVANILLDSIYKVNKNADEIAKAAEKVDFNNKEQVTEFYRTFVKPKMSEWIDTLRYNSMLSSPNTHIINISSNFQGTGLIAPLEKTITGGIDLMRSALTGKPREYAVGEGAAYAKGYYSKLAQASKDFWDVMKGDKFTIQPDVPVSAQIPKATSKIGKAVENTLAFPTRLLEAADNFFIALTEGGEKAALAYKQSKGIKEPSFLSSVTKKARERLFRGELNSQKQGPLLNSIDDVTGKILALRSSQNPVTSTIAKFTLPFVKTPMNLLKQGIEYSPAGLLTLPGAKNKTEQLSKIIIGLSSAAGAATLLGQDRLTWAEPTNPNQKAAFRDAGRQPYSIKIGDNWISYSKLHPALAFNFALLSSIDNEIKNKKLDESQSDSILSAFAKWGNFLADQSYLKNIGDFVAGTKGDVEGYAKTLSNYPTQLIPFRALMSWVERLTDPVQREADPEGSILEKQMQIIMSQIPGLAQKVPERTNAEGKPIPNQNSLLNAILPTRITTTNKEAENKLKVQEQMKKAEKDIKVERDTQKELVRPVYDEVQKLVSDGKIEEAQKIVDSLSDQDYEVYKSIKQAEQAKKTDKAKVELYPTYLEIQKLIDQGKIEDAQAIVDSMSNEDYRIYKLLKNQYE